MSEFCPYFKLSPENHQTTTATYHRFIPSFPQQFNVHVKPEIRPNLLVKDLTVKNETYKTETRAEYGLKMVYLLRSTRSSRANCISYIRPIQEKYLKLKVPPPNLKISETKSSYGINYGRVSDNSQQSFELFPNQTGKSVVGELFSIPIQQKGYWKYLDPYLTMNKCEYQFKQDSNYNAKERPRGISGSQPALCNRALSRAPKNLRLTSETKDKYKPISPYPTEFCIKVDTFAKSIC